MVGEKPPDRLPDDIGGRTPLGGRHGPQGAVHVFLEIDLRPPHASNIHHSQNGVYAAQSAGATSTLVSEKVGALPMSAKAVRLMALAVGPPSTLRQ
jgi:hypothetical protein